MSDVDFPDLSHYFEQIAQAQIDKTLTQPQRESLIEQLWKKMESQSPSEIENILEDGVYVVRPIGLSRRE